MPTRASIVGLLCAVAVAAGCAARPGGEDAPTAAAEPPAAVAGEVPEDLLAAMIADLAAKTGAEAGTVEVVAAGAVTWNDSSLGCAEPGKAYLQMLTEGHWVVLRHGGSEFDYRSGGGSFVLCDRADRKRPLR